MYIHKKIHKSFCDGSNHMYALHESTCVYEVEVESLLRDL
jgi:hypothetical protein